jgi:hypothetical protein
MRHQLVPFEIVDEALAGTGTTQRRIRELPSRVVVYVLLAGCLFPELEYPGVWRKLTAGVAVDRPSHTVRWQECPGRVPSTAARQRRSLRETLT